MVKELMYFISFVTSTGLRLTDRDRDRTNAKPWRYRRPNQHATIREGPKLRGIKHLDTTLGRSQICWETLVGKRERNPDVPIEAGELLIVVVNIESAMCVIKPRRVEHWISL